MSAIQSTADPGTANWIPEPLYPLTIEQYESMVEAGVLTTRDKVHLINGYLVAKMPKNPPHVIACHKTRVAFERMIADRAWHVRVESPVRLPPNSEPEPDAAVVRGAFLDYTQHPKRQTWP